MKITKDLLELLGQVKNAKSILDVGCGDGSFVNYLSKLFTNASVYGLDINQEFLASGIAKGNFENACPVQGDARMLINEKYAFSVVSLSHDAYSDGYVDWIKLQEKGKTELRNFDLVTALNPYNRLSLEEVNSLIRGEPMPSRLITVDVVSKAAKEGAFVLYGREIASRFGKMYGAETPDNVSENNISANLEILLSEGKRDNLKYMDHRLLVDSQNADLAILFNKTT
jgi:SAM-dependent methyltransferase